MIEDITARERNRITEQERSRIITRERNRIIACFIGLTVLWLFAASRIYINTSWSDDAWGYVLLPLGTPAIGEQVLFEPPVAVNAAVPYLKTVRGLPGAQVTVDGNRTVAVDGVMLGRAKTKALDGRTLEATVPGIVPDGHYYLHGDHVDSHDSRYAEIGLVARQRILGRALALPDLPWLGLEGPLVGPEDRPPGIPAVQRDLFFELAPGYVDEDVTRHAPGDTPQRTGGNGLETRP